MNCASLETRRALRRYLRGLRLAAVMAFAGLAAEPLLAQAQSPGQALAGNYPNKPVRFVVAFPAGSATDQTARLVAQQISKTTGQSVVVDNRGGANGFIAAEAVAKAAPDGYTVLLTTGTTHAANPALFKKLPYDPVRDFTPVTPLSLGGFILVVAPGFAAQNVVDLARLAKASPGKFSFASGNGPSRIGGEMFKMMSGADLLHVPYRGAPQALNDVIAGQVSMMWTDTRTGVPLVQSGKLKALAVTTRQRMSTLPQVPTMIEQGYPDYLLINWVGAYLPAKARARAGESPEWPDARGGQGRNAQHDRQWRRGLAQLARGIRPPAGQRYGDVGACGQGCGHRTGMNT